MKDSENPNLVKCFNPAKNRFEYYSKHMVKSPRWRKATGIYPAGEEPQAVEQAKRGRPAKTISHAH